MRRGADGYRLLLFIISSSSSSIFWFSQHFHQDGDSGHVTCQRATQASSRAIEPPSIITTTRHACWRRGQQRSSSIPVCHWPASRSLWFMPQLCFMLFVSASTVLRQVVFGRPRFRFLSGVQWIATFVMGVGILAQHVPKPATSLPGDDGLHILLLAPC